MSKIDHTEIMEEIRDIYMDTGELYISVQEDRDEDGVHYWKEVESSDLQDAKVKNVLLRFHNDILKDVHEKIKVKRDE